jgi:hypothetical protein
MVNKFMELFSGLSLAYGEYDAPKVEAGKKAKGKAKTVKKQVTALNWELHLSGIKGLGIVPIKEDSTVSFGAIDIDNYDNFDIISLTETIERHSWPLAVCRSKSGGAHIFIFTAEPIPSSIIRSKLKEIAVSLGHPAAEIFPKQDTIDPKRDIGNWINMPYFNVDDTDRFCISKGERLCAVGFLDFANSIRVLESDLPEIVIPEAEFSDAPPCLEILVAQGFPGGSMNNALFDLGVYARMKFPEDWHVKLYDYNKRFLGPGSAQEVQQVIKSLDKKKYVYRCQEPPICGYCNKALCFTRKYGLISESGSYKSGATQKVTRPCILDEVEKPVKCYEPAIGSSDEPYWVFNINGTEFDVTIDMVTSQIKFNRQFLKMFKRVNLPVDENRWANKMNELLSSADTYELAGDAGPEGQLWIHLENYCTGRVQARTQDELKLGKPWTNNDRVYFRSTEFTRYLDTNRFKEFKEREIYAILRRRGAEHHKFMIKGACVSCWSIPAFKRQDQDFDPPEPLPEEF